ncbi:pyridoxamine 5'-phosphate oxidase family protein [Lentibacillus saliphilus]|uniref:pyridoxamine 5'-phosphate oxidase family protein n=1 Tax=Lentibacillus saliphilus TaxID=2737028 RepID=UPI001C309D39|nr:pyridoxamine 5'-phosphate oxidase family protein [Lentibacillus saliphilus]
MDQKEIRESVEKILDESHVGTMATVKGNEPHSRYMTFMNDGLKLYTATSKETDKAEEIENNPSTHILLGYEGDGIGDDYVEYKGKVSFNESEEMKDKIWNDYMNHWFDGPNDPNYVVLEVDPVQIRLMNKNNLTPKELEL